MTVRFKSEYQKSYGVSRSKSASPRRCAPSAGLRSDQMGFSREPSLPRRKRLGGLARSCSSLLAPSDPPAHGAAPPAGGEAPPADRSSSAHRKKPKPPGRADPEPPAGPSGEPGAAGKSAKPRPSTTASQSEPSRPVTAAPDGQQPSTNEVERRGAGLRSGGQRSENHKQFTWKEPAAAASPLLNAEQALRSSIKSLPLGKKTPVTTETEYRRSFKGLAPTPEPRLRKHLEHEWVPLFHTHPINKKRREESEKRPRPQQEVPPRDDVRPLLLQRGQRIPEEGGVVDGDAAQVRELRLQAAAYRRRAWGAHFCRDHLSQLVSEHAALWEPTDTTASGPPTPPSRTTSCVEALDLPSRRSSAASGEKHPTNKTTEEEEENRDEEEGRLPTPRLKTFPAQRTHHDLTTPATGGAILVGRLKNGAESPSKQRCSSVVSMAADAVDLPVKRKEAWPEENPSLSTAGPSPDMRPAASHLSKPIRVKQTPPSPVAPPPHCIQGSLRHADFQHNGELGLRCSGGGCCSDEDDRLSVMSWRSAASCSMASAVLERAQKRRENFWGKR